MDANQVGALKTQRSSHVGANNRMYRLSCSGLHEKLGDSQSHHWDNAEFIMEIDLDEEHFWFYPEDAGGDVGGL